MLESLASILADAVTTASNHPTYSGLICVLVAHWLQGRGAKIKAKREEAKREEAKREEAKREEAKREQPNREQPKREQAKQKQAK